MILVLVLMKGDVNSLPGQTSKYSKAFTDEMTGRIAVILADAPRALRIDEFAGYDMNLAGISSQKMARMLNHLVEMGVAIKRKDKDGKMRYRAVALLEEKW